MRARLHVGDSVGNWTILEIYPYENGTRQVLCRCNLCGSEKAMRYNNIAKTFSCGCSKGKVPAKAAINVPSGPRPSPCAACPSYTESCVNYRTCERWHTWFRQEWSIIRESARRMKGQKDER